MKTSESQYLPMLVDVDDSHIDMQTRNRWKRMARLPSQREDISFSCGWILDAAICSFTRSPACLEVENPDDFKGKLAMDLGAGSGILSFFAVQVGDPGHSATAARELRSICRSCSVASGNSNIIKQHQLYRYTSTTHYQEWFIRFIVIYIGHLNVIN